MPTHLCSGVNHRFTASNVRSHLTPAVRAVVAQHPALQCGIIDETTPNPAFIRLESIDLKKHVEYHESDSSFAAEDNFLAFQQEVALRELLSRQHSRSWNDITIHPTWRIQVMMQTATPPFIHSAIEVSFLFHHALIDGLSGIAFHHSLLKALNSNLEPNDAGFIIDVPHTVSLAPSVENQLHLRDLPLNVTRPRLFLEYCNQHLPEWTRSLFSPWTGRPANLLPAVNFVSRLHVVDINAAEFHNFREICREYKTTFTAMLHAIIVLCLSRRRPNAKAFVACTPFSVRDCSNTPMDQLVNQISVAKTTFPRRVIKSFSNQVGNGEINEIANLASSFSRNLRKTLRAFPEDSTLSLLEYVSDLRAHFRGKLGKSREVTFEVSNLGAFCDPSRENNRQNGDKWNINRMLFTQSGSVVGNALSFNVVSVEDGPLTLSLTWQDGAVSERVVSNLLWDVRSCLVHISA